MDTKELIKHTLDALKQINESGKRSGVIACPRCGKTLHFSKHPDNGHVMAHCETDKCISFIQ